MFLLRMEQQEHKPVTLLGIQVFLERSPSISSTKKILSNRILISIVLSPQNMRNCGTLL